jgi:hypothetical protein
LTNDFFNGKNIIMDEFGNKFWSFQLTVSIFVLLTFFACSDPVGFPSDIRVYYNDDLHIRKQFL